MGWIEEVDEIPKNLIALLKGFSNSFRIQILDKINEENQISLSKIQKFTQKPNGFLLNHIHHLELTGVLQNFIQKTPPNREYSFYSMTDLGSLLYSSIKNTLLNSTIISSVFDNTALFVLKAISNPFRFALLGRFFEHSPFSFTELLSITNVPNTIIANHLHKLELGFLIQNYYQKKVATADYSFYEITPFGKTLIQAIKETYNEYYQLKCEDQRILKSDPKPKIKTSMKQSLY